MALVSIQDVSVSFGGPLVLEHVDLQVEKGERVAPSEKKKGPRYKTEVLFLCPIKTFPGAFHLKKS